MAAKTECIEVINARENNLKCVCVSIPMQSLTCVTGVSGGGKSSLVYDTIYAESQREFLESMSGNMYGQKLMDKPKVDKIHNLRPALNVAQTYYNFNPRSSVGTITDISYYLRALYALICGYENKRKYSENYFSYNNPTSFCHNCKGRGISFEITESMLMPNPQKTLRKGGILFYKGKDTSVEFKLLSAICEKYGIDIDKKVGDLTKSEKQVLLYRNSEEEYFLNFKTPKGRYKKKTIRSKGAIVELEEQMKDKSGLDTNSSVLKYAEEIECPFCHGKRLNNDVLKHLILGKDIGDIEAASLNNIKEWLEDVCKYYAASPIYEHVHELSNQMISRIQSIVRLNVDYLSLNRSVPSLSGGEIQRLRIANQLNCDLKGLIYILDEPCKGLHFRNISGVIDAVKALVDKGNTVLAIEHNRDFISETDYIIELGPEGGNQGGNVIFEGNFGDYLLPPQNENIRRNNIFESYISIYGITWHNLVNQDVKFPFGGISFITGVSGSGKSSLASVIEEAFTKKQNFHFKSIEGQDFIKKAYKVNQKPIGKTSRSTVASYLEIFDIIRDLFASTDRAKAQKLKPSDFSTNLKGGRCEHCQGTGKEKIELNYLPSSYITCTECNGRRYHEDVLSVLYKGLSIDDVLDKPVSELNHVFQDNAVISRYIKCMIELGLGYISLGQMSMYLSGGEAQRIKLVKALAASSSKNNLYLLDEPTSGLSTKDIEKLENVLTELNHNGNTILIIDHNRSFITHIADYIIDFGLKAGESGGKIVAQGLPDDVFQNKISSWKEIP